MAVVCSHTFKTIDSVSEAIVTHMGQINVTKVGCIDGFVTPIRGIHTMTLCLDEPGSGVRFCAVPTLDLL